MSARTNKSYDTFNPVAVKTQVVAGLNYLFKVDVGNGEFIWVKVYQPLPHTGEPPELLDLEEGKTDADDF